MDILTRRMEDSMKTISIFILTLVLSLPAWADVDIENCIAEHQNCTTACLQMDTGASQAACVAQCAGSEAQCVGHVGLKRSEPLIRRKAEQLENLLKDFFGDILPEFEQKPPPGTNQSGSTDT